MTHEQRNQVIIDAYDWCDTCGQYTRITSKTKNPFTFCRNPTCGIDWPYLGDFDE